MVEVDLDQTEEWDDRDWRALAERAVAEAFAVAGARPDRGISLSICLATDDEVQALNAQWRGKDKPTNVLSFPMLDGEALDALKNASPTGEILLGDLILAYSVCLAEAAEKQIPLVDHVAHLIIHGTLHLLGYDHINEPEAEHMEALEVKALASLGIANPY
jgi:probable rRNA maturation factor